MSVLTLACLATGDEIIEGKTTNTNAKFISELLFSEGFQPLWHMASNDNENNILSALEYLSEKVNCIIITGGLGPTSDDRTRFALARYLNQALIEHPDAINHISSLKPNKILSTGDRQQALFPKSASLLENPYGTAMGCIIQHCKQTFILLPGPPRECMPMLIKHVLPILHQQQKSDLRKISWMLFGIRESEIASQFDEVLKPFQSCQTGFRLDPPYVECKVRCLEEDFKTIKDLVETKFNKQKLLTFDIKASNLLIEALTKKPRKLNIIDQVTGGWLQTTLTTKTTKDLLKFTDNISTQSDVVNIICKGLDHYWQDNAQSSNLIILELWTYDNKSLQSKCVRRVEHPCEFKSSLALGYAVEWLSAQFFICLDLIHQLTT